MTQELRRWSSIRYGAARVLRTARPQLTSGNAKTGSLWTASSGAFGRLAMSLRGPIARTMITRTRNDDDERSRVPADPLGAGAMLDHHRGSNELHRAQFL